MSLPTDSAVRKGIPIVTGVLDYFSAAIAEVAKISLLGNEKHNPGQPLHWARGKSTDHADAIGRHLLERGGWDTITVAGVDHPVRHSAELAWRALANLQQELESEGAAVSRGSVFPGFEVERGLTPPPSAEEAQREIALPEGFLHWAGGSTGPVDFNAEVEVVLRNGAKPTPRIAGEFFWGHDGDHDDIVGYREVNPPIDPSALIMVDSNGNPV